MKYVFTIAAMSVLTAGCQSMAASPQLTPTAYSGQKVSREANAFVVENKGKRTRVRVSQSASGAAEKFQEYGTVFTVAAFNLGTIPLGFGPESVSVQYNGIEYPAMSAEEVAGKAEELRREREAGSTALSIFGNILGAVAPNVSESTSQALLYGQKAAEIAGQVKARADAQTTADAAVMMQNFSKDALPSTALPAYEGNGGFVVVAGLKDAQSYTVKVKVGGDIHHFTFGRSQQASR